MCIIAHKPRNVVVHEKWDTWIENSWHGNNDGAGWALNRNGTITWSKGFMKLKNLQQSLSRLNITTDDGLTVHFRTATHGGVRPALTHPMLVSGNRHHRTRTGTLQQGETLMFHNGIMSGLGFYNTGSRESDTSEMAKELAQCPEVLAEKRFKVLKKALFTSAGRILLISIDHLNDVDVESFGSWDKEGNWYFSNTGYRWASRVTYPTGWGAGNTERHNNRDLYNKHTKPAQRCPLCYYNIHQCTCKDDTPTYTLPRSNKPEEWETQWECLRCKHIWITVGPVQDKEKCHKCKGSARLISGRMVNTDPHHVGEGS